MAINFLIKRAAVPVLNAAAKGGAALGKAAAKKFAKPEKLITGPRKVKPLSESASRAQDKAFEGAARVASRVRKDTIGAAKSRTVGKAKAAKKATGKPRAEKGRPVKGREALRGNINAAIKQVRAKKDVKAKTGVRNEGRPVKNSRATSPAQRDKALTARVSNSNKVAAAKTARGGTKLSKPSTVTRTSTDSLKSRVKTPGGSLPSSARSNTTMKANRAKNAAKRPGTNSTERLTRNVDMPAAKRADAVANKTRDLISDVKTTKITGTTDRVGKSRPSKLSQTTFTKKMITGAKKRTAKKRSR